jgi:hypothetical protein
MIIDTMPPLDHINIPPWAPKPYERILREATHVAHRTLGDVWHLGHEVYVSYPIKGTDDCECYDVGVRVHRGRVAITIHLSDLEWQVYVGPPSNPRSPLGCDRNPKDAFVRALARTTRRLHDDHTHWVLEFLDDIQTYLDIHNDNNDR